jgi:hypothetical protein
MEPSGGPQLQSWPPILAAPPVFVTGRSRWLALLSLTTVVLLVALAAEIATTTFYFPGADLEAFEWRHWCFKPLILGTAVPLLVLFPAHVPVALRRVSARAKTGVMVIVSVVTVVSLSLGYAGWHSRVSIKPELLAAASRLTPPPGFTAVGRPETGITPHSIDTAQHRTWQLWVPTAATSDLCAALSNAYGRLPGWQVQQGGSNCSATRRSGRTSIVLTSWSGPALRQFADLPGAPSQPGITVEVGPNFGADYQSS